MLKNLIKDKRGVSLAELIVVMGIMGVLAIACSSLVASASSAYKRSRLRVEALNIGYAITYDIEERIKNADEIYIATDELEPVNPCKKFYVEESEMVDDKDVLYFGDFEMYGANAASVNAFYSEFSLKITWKAGKSNPNNYAVTSAEYLALNNDLLTLNISCTDSSGKVYDCEPVSILLFQIKGSENGIMSDNGVDDVYKKNNYDATKEYTYLYFYKA